MSINEPLQLNPAIMGAKISSPSPLAKGKELSKADLEKIESTAQEFEAMFLSEMYKPIFETVEVDETFGGGKGEEIFRSFLRDEYSKELAKTNTLGIATLVKDQLIKMQSQENEEKFTSSKGERNV